MNPMDNATFTSHTLKADAILIKIAKIIPNNYCQKCNGLYQID